MSQFDEDPPLGYLLHRVVAVLRPHVNAELRELGIGLPDVVCMRLLDATPGLSSADLARTTNVSAQAMNQVLNRLEDLGAVTRPTIAANRTLPAQLTPQGKKLLRRGHTAIRFAEQKLLDSITTAELRQLKRLLHKAGNRADGAQSPSVSAEQARTRR